MRRVPQSFSETSSYRGMIREGADMNDSSKRPRKAATADQDVGAPGASTRDSVPLKFHRHRHSVQSPTSASSFGGGADTYLMRRHRKRHSKAHHHIKDALQTTIPEAYQDIAANQISRSRGHGGEDTTPSSTTMGSRRGSRQLEEMMSAQRALRPQDVEKESWRQSLRDEYVYTVVFV